MNFVNKFRSFNSRSRNLHFHYKEVENKLSVHILKVMMRTLILFIAPPVVLQVMIQIRCIDLRNTTIVKETLMSKLTFRSSKGECIMIIFSIGFIPSNFFNYREVSKERKMKLVAIKLKEYQMPKYKGIWWENLKRAHVHEGRSRIKT